MSTEDSLNLSTLSPSEGSRRPRKRVGFGSGSGLGKTCGKGQKGQKSRSGASIPAGFEGGQMPIHRRLPKRGFASRKRVLGLNTYSVVSIERLAAQTETEFTVASLRKAGLVAKKPDRIKLLAGGELSKAIKVEVHAASASALAAVEKAGGTVTIIKTPAKEAK